MTERHNRAEASAGGGTPRKQDYLAGRRILPLGLTGKETGAEMISDVFLAYNSARIREACELFTRKMLGEDVTVGMSLSGALTPAGLGCSCIIPLIKAGFVDWIVSTGANLYHDLHFAFDCQLHVGSHLVDDADLKANEIVRIYDILLDYTGTLLLTDQKLREILAQPEFQKEMGSGELHNLLGKYAAAAEKANKLSDVSVLAAAYRAGVPIYTSSPGDSTIGMNVAAMELDGSKLRVNPSIDVNETSAYVHAAKAGGGQSAVLMWGGGSPKNFILQTEPQIQEILMIPESGHDYFLQVTDARPDTGGLSGATPQEAVSWNKVDPSRLPDAVVCYVDTTIAMPLITHYALATHAPRQPRRLFDRRQQLLDSLRQDHLKSAGGKGAGNKK